MFFYNPIKLKIHCWGGFGSQLHAAFLAIYIQQAFRRRVIVIFHSDGITKRDLELEPFLKGLDFKVVDDFVLSAKNKKLESVNAFKELLLKILKILILKSQIVSHLDNADNLVKLRFWTLSLRGHYSNIGFDLVFYKRMFSRLLESASINEPLINGGYDWIIHYRLGDLLHANKNLISSNTIVGKLQEFELPMKILVLSDSPAIALKSLSDELEKQAITATLHSKKISSTVTLLQCVYAKNFLGTTSKVSIWIAVFRLILESNGKTAMPITLKNNLKYILEDNLLSGIDYYKE